MNMRQNPPEAFYTRIREILASARSGLVRTVNTAQVLSNWLIGRAIVEEEQQGQHRAEYGENLLQNLAQRLKQDFGAGYSYSNLKYMRQFYLAFPQFLTEDQIRHTLCDQLPSLRNLADMSVTSPVWQPGQFHPNLSWSHYRILMKLENPDAKAFYEIETLKNNWSVRELERQIGSLLFERLAKSTDKQGLMKLATQGQIIQKPADVFKDPFVMEFLGLPASPRLVESDLENALINNLQTFLLELGKGFAFVNRQERITLDGDHFYIDLVFYHTILKCYILIDLKVGKLNHTDLGQLQLYVNFYDRERCQEDDNPTLGLILCSDKNDAVVRYTLGADQQNKIFASRYKLHLPTEAELQAELQREIAQLQFQAPPE
ncbi:MAG: PDDEXK nuclease domain-containing protein [Oculatellaceae cyanobacterium Prado106]|nr:PDDEXK nuclease domain-containing protein [Oculatellaceae cyanobacterium Prado106]